MQDSADFKMQPKVQLFLMDLHIRFSLSLAADPLWCHHLPAKAHEVTEVQLQQQGSSSDTLSSELSFTWSAFLLSLLDTRCAILQQWTAVVQPDALYHAKPATEGLAALSSGAAMAAQTAQQSGGHEESPGVTETTAEPQAADAQQRLPGEQAAKGLPECNSYLLQTVALCGLEAFMQSKQNWSQLATETYQACVWTFAQAARRYITSNGDKQNIHSVQNIEQQLLFIGVNIFLCTVSLACIYNT